MSHSLHFDILHRYPAGGAGILVRAQLALGGRWVDLIATIDTGSSFCIFERRFGELLGLDVEAGLLQKIATATGFFRAYGHELTLEVLGLRFDSMVFFAEPPGFSRNVLGRRGWLDRVRLAVVEHDSRLYLSPYSR
jgi:hypothetical protein